MKKKRILPVLCILLVLFAGVSSSALAAECAPLKAADLDLYVREDGAVLRLGQTEEEMKTVLGQNASLERLPSCLFEGEDHTWTYENVVVYTHPENNSQVIDQIEVTGQAYPTRRGIWVGSEVGDVIERYGRRYEKSGETMSYYITKQMRLVFTIEGGFVASYSLYNVDI